jgi:agmatine/peptidylarginine deiminase
VILDGGNLLSNGTGLFLATTSLIDENQPLDYDREQLEAVLDEYLGCTRIEFLETLVGEPTRHVDMFATFTDANTVVVGAYDSRVDPVNARILDRNAACLAAVEWQHGPLRVVRVPMPPKNDGVWRTYTNVIFANGVLLVPVYPRIDPEGDRVALETFRHLLPDWDVVGIDAGGIAQRGGALHCISMNVPVGYAGRPSDLEPVNIAGAAR